MKALRALRFVASLPRVPPTWLDLVELRAPKLKYMMYNVSIDVYVKNMSNIQG